MAGVAHSTRGKNSSLRDIGTQENTIPVQFGVA